MSGRAFVLQFGAVKIPMATGPRRFGPHCIWYGTSSCSTLRWNRSETRVVDTFLIHST